jgi:hypothetical protein
MSVPENVRSIAPREATGIDLSGIERVIIAGDLSKLTPEERWNYYQGICQSVGLNPFTKPFEYITLNGKLTLYALKGATDQLRGVYGLSMSKPDVRIEDGLCIASVTVTGANGRTDSDIGAVPIDNLKGDARANAIMKAITKAKRRTTLSYCGLGMLDESEVETIRDARHVHIDPVPQGAITTSYGGSEPTDEEIDAARAMVRQSPEVVAGLREQAIARCYELARYAELTDDKMAQKIVAKNPDTLSDERLREWVMWLEDRFPNVTSEDVGHLEGAVEAAHDDESF